MPERSPANSAGIARATIDAAEAAASLIRLRARDPGSGKPDSRPEARRQVLPVIKRLASAVIKGSAGGRLGMTTSEWLDAATSASPEVASLDMGSTDFGFSPLLEMPGGRELDREPEFLADAMELMLPDTFAVVECDIRHQGRAHDTECEFECHISGASTASGISLAGT